MHDSACLCPCASLWGCMWWRGWHAIKFRGEDACAACLPMFTFVYTSCHYITVIGIILLGATSKSSVFRGFTIMIGGKVLRDGSEEQAKVAV